MSSVVPAASTKIWIMKVLWGLEGDRVSGHAAFVTERVPGLAGAGPVAVRVAHAVRRFCDREEQDHQDREHAERREFEGVSVCPVESEDGGQHGLSAGAVSAP